MVGPISDEERESATVKVKLAFTVLIGLSAGLVTLQADPSPATLLAATLGGLVVGGLLVWYVFPDSISIDERRGRL